MAAMQQKWLAGRCVGSKSVSGLLGLTGKNRTSPFILSYLVRKELYIMFHKCIQAPVYLCLVLYLPVEWKIWCTDGYFLNWGYERAWVRPASFGLGIRRSVCYVLLRFRLQWESHSSRFSSSLVVFRLPSIWVCCHLFNRASGARIYYCCCSSCLHITVKVSAWSKD